MSLPSSSPTGTGMPDRIGPFVVHGVLGKGGMGVVFDARAPDGRDVALKVVRPVGDSERARLLLARFLREAKILGQLDHPGIVRLVDAGDDQGLFYLAMERIEGVSLLAIRRKGALDFSPLVELGAQIADALAHMHAAGVIHRDIKPANILIEDSGQPVITDFGISGLSEATGITRHGDLLGSPGFMAPEVMDGSLPTPASDLYALGRLIFELGARGPAQKIPKNAPILRILAAAMTIDWTRFPKHDRWPELASHVDCLLARDPQLRFGGNAREVTRVLQGLMKSDVLDFETLSEQVERMAIDKARSWEILADDLDLPSDELIDNLESPAGLRALSEPTGPADPFEDETRVPPPTVKQTAELPSFDDAGDATQIAPDREPTKRPGELTPERRLSLPVPGQKFEDSPGVSLDDLIRQTPPPDYSVASGDDGTATTVAPPPGPDPRVSRLERQLTRTRDDVVQQKKAIDALKSSRMRWRILAASALGIGMVVGVLASTKTVSPSLVLVPKDVTRFADPKHRMDPNKPVTEAERRDGREMLEAAKERLAARDLDGAERLLGLCIEVSDLPACHKRLATMLTLTGDHERARTHFQHYLDTAPNDPDAATIDKLLRE